MISFNWLKSLKRNASCTRVSRRNRVKAHGAMANISMQLESRVLLSATASYDATTHSLHVSSTDSESLTISSDAGHHVMLNGVAVQNAGANVSSADVYSILVNGGVGSNVIDLNEVTKSAFPMCQSVTINGNGGDDTIHGSEYGDVIKGGSGNDSSFGGIGDEVVTFTCEARVGKEGSSDNAARRCSKRMLVRERGLIRGSMPAREGLCVR